MSLRTLARRFVGGGLAATGAGAAGICVAAVYDEGTGRSTRFWWNAFPLYLRYRHVQFLNKDLPKLGAPAFLTIDDDEADSRYENLHNTYADTVRDLVYDMRGFYLKNAQFLSIRDDFIPPQYLTWCKDTQTMAPTEFQPGEARKAVDASLKGLGLDPDKVFESWEEEPCGVASIGQVHRAVLKPEYRRPGQTPEVVVKVQAPGIERRFRADIKTCIAFCELAMPQHVKPLEEIERQFLTEFDYAAEAANLRAVRENIMPHWRRQVYIPAPYEELCTKEVLVMEEVPGIRLTDGVRERFARIAAQRGTTLEALEAEHRHKLQAGLITPSSVAAEMRRTWWTNKALLVKDLCFSLNPVRAGYNMSVFRLVTGPWAYKWTEPLVDLGGVLKVMIDVHAHQVFEDGLFNGDPHPGNILLMPDGRLGLIDYGQVKRVSLETRVSYAKLVVALCVEDEAEVQRIVREEFGGRSRHGRRDVAYRLTAFWCDRDTADITLGMNLQEFMTWCEEQDPVEVSPLDMVMIARVSAMIRGLGNAFNIRLRCAPAWREPAERLLRAQGVDYPFARLPTAHRRSPQNG